MGKLFFLINAILFCSLPMIAQERITKHLEEYPNAAAGETVFKHWAHDLNKWAKITVSGKKTYEYLPYINDKVRSRYDFGAAHFLQKVDKTNWKFYKIEFDGGIERIDVYFIDEVQLKSSVSAPRQKTVNGQTVYYLVLKNHDKNSSYGLTTPFDWRVYMGARADLSDRDKSGDSTLEIYFQNKAEAEAAYNSLLSTFE